jgi:hypothetical protein
VLVVIVMMVTIVAVLMVTLLVAVFVCFLIVFFLEMPLLIRIPVVRGVIFSVPHTFLVPGISGIVVIVRMFLRQRSGHDTGSPEAESESQHCGYEPPALKRFHKKFPLLMSAG